MLRRVPIAYLCIGSAVLFTFLFHGTGIGINLLLFECAMVGLWAVLYGLPRRSDVGLTIGGILITAAMVAVHASSLAITMNIIAVVIGTGVLLAPQLGALHHAAALSATHFLHAQGAFLGALPLFGGTASTAKRFNARTWIPALLAPLVILLFIAIYRASNPRFDALMDELDADIALVFLLGLSTCAFLLFRTYHTPLQQWAAKHHDAVLPTLAMEEADHQAMLLAEARTAVLLIGMLDLVLLVVNVLDVRYVWFDFRFEGQYLKQFVHEGTYLLILSILLGAAIVLYYFRGDLNFIRNSGALRWLSYAWLLQNALLAVSVGVRNARYIEHYALAYKRIGVGFFLVAIIAALVIILLKVHRRRSHHYVVRWNMRCVFALALLMSVFDWDTIIARYNMAHRERAFIELKFLTKLAYKTLPLLVRSKLELENLDSYNREVLGGTHRYNRWLYMEPVTYAGLIDERIQRFTTDYPQRSWREWNLAEDQAYHVLKPYRIP
ncbi:MAG: DUF4173 domain-containing protein [Flavobacteriales bacterium]|nr:DUF4173 domain-containing protein [Flavobacteriales bacterium]